MPDVRFIAHRGSSATRPEHTRAAYVQALRDGADGIETDVRLTADGEVVCWHDATVDRTSNGRGRVRELSLSQLRGLDVLRGHLLPDGFGRPDEQLVTLRELIDIVEPAGRALLLVVELKADRGAEQRLVDATLDILDAATPRLPDLDVSLMSFSRVSADAVLSRDRQVMLLAQDGQDTSFRAIDRGPYGAGPDIEWVRRFPDTVHRWVREGRDVRVWTVDTLADLMLCVELGVREITTNRPAELRAEYRSALA
ncbi:MAG TPA: glycerophosphodiester phosphodiesterase family protein [Naasia sp.]|jgi:glycerophosphoryl diester phosphodiesterase